MIMARLCFGQCDRVARVRAANAAPPVQVNPRIEGHRPFRIVVEPSQAAIKMAESLGEVVEQIQHGIPPATAHLKEDREAETARSMFRNAKIKGVLVVLNRSSDVMGEVRLAEKIPETSNLHLIGALKEDLAIGRAWFDGYSVSSPENENRVRGIATRIEAAEGASSDTARCGVQESA